MRISIAAIDGWWANGGMPNEEDEMLLDREEVARDARGGYGEEEEEGEFDHYEPQSPGTPASSPCPASPTTPTFSDSSNCYNRRLIFSSPTYIETDMSSPPTTGVLSLSPAAKTVNSTIAPVGGQKPKTTIYDLPPELLHQVLKCALDEDWMYDYLEGYDGNSDALAEDGKTQGIPVVGEDRNIGFRLIRVEIRLSQVCKWWRNVIKNHLDLWELGESMKKCIHVTGQQWFNPSFPFSILEGREGYDYINISFSNFSLSPDQFRPTCTLYDAPLFDAPEGSDFHDEVAPHRRILLDATSFIRLKLNNGSDVAIDKVLQHLEFPMVNVLKIITTVNSESRFWVSEMYSHGLRHPCTGGIYTFDDGTSGPGELEHGISLGFEINSWRRGWGSEIGTRIGDLSRWFCPDSEDYAHYGLHVKLPKMDGVKRDLQLPRVGWRDKIAQIVSHHPEQSVWDEWDNTLCNSGRLCEHQFQFARLDGFADNVQQLQFSLLGQNAEGVALHLGCTWREKMLLMLHPLKTNYLGYHSGLWDIDTGDRRFAVGVKGLDVSGQMVAREEGCACESTQHYITYLKGHWPRGLYRRST